MCEQTNRELFFLLRDSGTDLKDYKKLCELLISKNAVSKKNETNTELRERVRNYCSTLSKKWQATGRGYDKFIKKMHYG